MIFLILKHIVAKFRYLYKKVVKVLQPFCFIKIQELLTEFEQVLIEIKHLLSFYL